VDEAGVGAVLQQTPDQIGQQVLVAAHGRIGAEHDLVGAAVGGFVEGLAHAVQALELDGDIGRLGHGGDGGQGMGVVRRELAVEVRRGVDDGASADQIAQVGRGLGRVDGIVGSAVDLGALDLAVPVGALHQPDHEATPGLAGELGHRFDHMRTALLIGLNGQTEACPGAQLRLARQRSSSLSDRTRRSASSASMQKFRS
jgi:hypothetical protein